MKILVTGGCGYIGSVLVPKLLALGHQVLVVDLQWFGNYLVPHENLSILKIDVRGYVPLANIDAIIHLAAVANDPQGELNPKLTWEVNALATQILADHAARHKVKQFIYASSGSVYGVSKEPQVTEKVLLNPLSDYNKTKMVAERVLLSYADRMGIQILRPATVCGYSPRQRLDVVVNLLTIQALSRHRITVLGGDQMRPNIHMEDMIGAYLFMLKHPELTGVYNVGFENLSVLEIAQKVAGATGAVIDIKPSQDPRSYRMNSDKIVEAGFIPGHDVRGAIAELCLRYGKGQLVNDVTSYNLKAMPQ